MARPRETEMRGVFDGIFVSGADRLPVSAGVSPPVRHSVSNGPSLREAPARFGNWIVETVKRAADAAGFQLLPRRWVVERTPRLAPIETAAWARDFEASIASKAWVYITSVQLLIRRL